MKYSQGEKLIVVRTAPAGGCTADSVYVIGDEVLVAVDDITAGDEGPFVREGGVALPPKAGDIPADGGKCYLDTSTGEVQATYGTGLYMIGTRDANNPNDDGSSLIGVVLAAVPAIEGDVGNVIQSADAGAEEYITVAAGTDRSQKAVPVGVKAIADSATVDIGAAIEIRVDATAATAVIPVFTSAPFAFRVLDAQTFATATVASGTAKLNNAADGTGTDITDAMAMDTAGNIIHATTLNGSVAAIAKGGGLSIVKADATDQGYVIIHAMVTGW